MKGIFGDYNTRMPLLLASGEEMDILWTARGSNDFRANASDGYFDGQIRTIWSQQIAAFTATVRLNMTLAEEYGFDPSSVESPEDLEPFPISQGT